MYVGSCSGVFFAFERSTGRTVWTYDTRQDGPRAQFHGDPLLTDDLVVAPSDSTPAGYVYAFDRKTGAVRWKTAVGGLETDLLRSGGSALGSTTGGALVALDLATGKVIWKLETRSGPGPSRVRSPALSGDRLFFPGLDGKVYALRAATGEILWQRDLGSAVTTAILLAEGHLFVGALNHRLYRLDPATGAVTAEHDAGDYPHSVLTFANGTLVALVGEKTLRALDPDLKLRWTGASSVPWSTLRPLNLGDTVLVGNEEGEMTLLRLADGTVAWSGRIDGMPRGLSLAGGTLYVGTLRGAVLAFEASFSSGSRPSRSSGPRAD